MVFLGMVSASYGQLLDTKANCGNPIPIDFTVTITSNYNGQVISCNGACDGEVTVTVNSGGGGPYGFEYFDGASTVVQGADIPGGTVATFIGLCADNYNFTLIDSSQLIFGTIFESCTEFGIILSDPNNIGVNLLGFIDPSCPDSCDGQIFANIGGGTAPLNILWVESGSTVASPSGICTGNNTVQVTDTNNCFYTEVVTVNDPDNISFGIDIQEVSCDGGIDGSALSTPVGANGGPFDFTWELLPGNVFLQNNNGASDLLGGRSENQMVLLTLLDVNGCPFDTTITFADISPIVVTEDVNLDASCPNVCDGQIDISISGGSGVYTTIQWVEGLVGAPVGVHTIGPSLTQNDLCPNTDYFVFVEDDNGCQIFFQLNQVIAPPPFTFAITNQQDVTCNGANNGLIDITVGGGSPIPGYNYTWSSADGSGFTVNNEDQINVLSGGTYRVIYEDAVGCLDSADIVIVEPDAIFTNGIVTNVSCFDLSDGSIDLTTTGGNGGYVWTWTSSANGNIVDNSLEDQSSLDSASYSVNIIDALGCSYDTTIIITKPGEIFFNSVVTQMQCANDNDAVIDNSAASNGFAPFSFVWTSAPVVPIGDPNGVSNSSLEASVYTIMITDFNTCDKDTVITINALDPLVLSSSFSDVLCNGANDGSISIIVVTGEAPVGVTWTGPTAIANNNFSPNGLSPGNYQATVTDVNGCFELLPFNIGEPAALVATLSGTNVDCAGLPVGGSVLVVPSGGLSGTAYDIDWDVDIIRGDFDDAAAQGPLTAGTYCVNIRDDNNCVLALDSCITITAPDSIFFLGSTQIDVSCFGANDGSVNAVASGGTEAGAYDFSWTVPACSVPFGNFGSIAPLCVGTYTVTATDDNGCTNDTTFVIDEPGEIVVTEVHTDVVCNGANDGTITLTVVSGDGPFTVVWTVTGGGTAIAGNTNFTPTGLAPGNYDALVADVNNCTELVPVVIGEPAALVATLSGTNVDCAGLPVGGSVTVVPSGGLTGTAYDIDWDTDPRGDFDDAATQAPLLAGTYCVNIRDDNNCVLALDSCITIIEPDSIFFNGTAVSEINCFGANNGSVNLSVTGGTEAGAYDFSWNPIPPCSAPLGNNGNVGPLCPGSYTVTVTDDNGCTNDTTFNFIEPVVLTALTSSTDASCGVDDGTVTVTPSGGTVAGSYNINWTAVIGTTPPTPSNGTNITGLTADTYNVTVTDDNGCSVTGQEIIQSIPPPIITIDQVSNLNCNGNGLGAIQTTTSGGLAPYTTVWGALNDGSFTASSDDIFLLNADQYTIQVTDANLCIAVMVVDVTEPNALQVILDNQLDLDCNGLSTGELSITGQGGVIAVDYIYSWTGTGSYSNNVDDINSLPIGTYCVNITDDNGCTMSSDSCYTLIEPTVLQIDNISSTDAQCNVANGSATVVASGGTIASDYTYSWVNVGAGANPTVDNASTATGMINDPYTVTVTDDNGCSATATVAVQPTNGPAVTIDFINHLTCANDGTGAISTTAGGGSGTLTYSWSSIPAALLTPNPGNVADLNGLEGGTYIVNVTDGASCTTNEVIVINEPTPLTIVDNIVDAVCNGDDGFVDITVAGGTTASGNYSYNWDNNGGSTFTDPEDLIEVAGTYNVVAVDDNGCTINGGPYVIDEPTAITTSTSFTSSACLQSTGSVTVTPGGGTPGAAPNEYAYLWTDQLTSNPVGNAPTASPLPSGCYDVQVTDVNGCVVTATECISDLNGPTITVDQQIDPTCNGGADGQVDLTISTTAGPTTSTWTSTNGSPFTVGGSPEDILNLGADDYNITVTDANLCSTTQSFTLVDIDAIDVVATILDPNCANGNDGSITITVINGAFPPLTSTSWTGPSGFTASTQDISSLLSGTYCLTIVDANNCQLDTCFTLNPIPALSVSTSFIDTDCSSPIGQVNATAGGGTPGYIYDWTGPGITVHPSGALVTGLDVGTYNLTVTDANGCITLASETINTLTGPIVNLDGTNDVNCFGDATGDIFISVAGGSLPYIFDWDNIAGVNDPEDNLAIPAGTYIVIATDAAGCDDTLQVLINGPAAALNLSGVENHLDCNADGSGSIDLIVSGGTTDYTIDWTQGVTPIGSIISSTGVFTIPNLDALSYDVLVTDGNGCTTTQNFVLNEPTAIVPSTSFLDSDCGLSNGQVSASPTGGTDGVTYTFSWIDFNTGLPTTTPNQATVPGLPQGTYEVTIEDLNGCQVTALTSVSEVGGPSVSGTTTPVQCFGDLNGTISLNIIGPPTLSFVWTGPTAIGNVQNPVSLNAGNYAVAVTDGNGCVTNDNFTITGPTSPLTVNGVATPLVCFEDEQGAINLTITGGTPGFIYSWTGPNGYTNNNEDINNLEAGTYIVDVEDSQGCQVLGTNFIVNQPGEIIVTPNITEPSCGVANGSVIANVVGGTLTSSPDYTYEWTDLSGPTLMPDIDNDIALIFAGNYQLIVEDDNGCRDTAVVSLSNVLAPSLSFATTEITCFGFNDGSIDLTVIGANTYTYDWDNLAGSSDPEDQLGLDLSPGTYSVLVFESPTGCVSAGSVTLADPDELTVSGVEDHLECFEDGTGGIAITPLGGTGTLIFDWDNLAGTSDPQNQTSIGSGAYQVTVTDINGCTTIDSYTLTEPLEIDITAVITQNTCNGQQLGEIDVTTINGVGTLIFAWDTPSTNEDETALFAGFYQFDVTDANGCTYDSIFEITEPAPFIFNGVVTDASCNLSNGEINTAVTGGTLASPDYTYSWLLGGVDQGSTTGSLLLRPAGTYVLTVTDDAGCSLDTTIVINNINSPVLTVDNIVDVTCFGDADGDINISTSGGTAPYTYVWNPNGVAQTEDLTDQPAGTYDLQVTDAIGCINTLTGLVIDSPDQVGGAIASNDATCGICNGDATVTGFGGDGSFNYLWSSANTLPLESAMCPGVYNVQITDGAGCSVIENVVINNIAGPTGEIISTVDPDCNGGTDGTATVTAIGGVSPITYFWTYDGTLGPTHSNLPAGTYFVEMSDFNGCIRIAQVDIFEPNAIAFNSNISLSTCNNADGDITLTNITGGAAPISILWNNPVGLNTPGNPNIPAGIYNVTLTDATGCAVVQNFTITDQNAPDLTLVPTDVLCNADVNGMITSSITGAVGAISYQWLDASPAVIAGEINPDINPVGTGDYTLQATDAGTGCVALETVTIDEPDVLTLSLPNVQDASCDIACDGEATVIVTGGTLPYTFNWPSGATSQTATDLCVGLNTVSISDVNGCIIQTTIVVDFDNQLSAAIVETDATCGDCDGLATVNPNGGSGSYTVNWYDATTGLSHNQLCAGIYDFTIVDNANGCSTDLNATINNIGGPDNETITVTDVSCNGGVDGGATVVPSGGTSPYGFLWVPAGQNSGTISGQAAGNYNLEVTDANGCIRVVPVSINEPSGMDLQFLSIDANCGNSDGTITLIPVNGVAPINYVWNGPGLVNTTNQSESNLAIGIYNISATDASGCTVTIQVPISTTTPPSFTVSANDITCSGLDNGDATAVGAGLNFDWSTGLSGATISGLSEGTYVVTGTDPLTGCSAVQSVAVNEPDTLMMAISNVDAPLCFGDCTGEITAVAVGGSIPYSYTWSSSANTGQLETGLCNGITTTTVTDANGCITSEDITLVDPQLLTVVTDNVIDATCINSQDGAVDITAAGGAGSYTYAWTTTPAGFTSAAEDLVGLYPTTYNLTVTDDNGCIAIEIVPVDTIFIVLADAGLDTSFCLNNCLIIQGSGIGPAGIIYEWNTLPVTTILSTADTLEFCPNTEGFFPFTLTVSDANCSHTDTIVVTVNSLPIVDAGPDLDEVIGSFQNIGGAPTGPINSTYYWTPNTYFISLNDTAASNPEIEMNIILDYIVYVTDTNGCVNSDTVNVRPIPEITFPNGFTPNGDGLNDDWQIDYIDQFPECVVEVYNRWGELLFRNVGYTIRWDGKYEGNDLPVGTYYYIIELNDPLFPEPYSGPITIMR